MTDSESKASDTTGRAGTANAVQSNRTPDHEWIGKHVLLDGGRMGAHTRRTLVKIDRVTATQLIAGTGRWRRPIRFETGRELSRVGGSGYGDRLLDDAAVKRVKLENAVLGSFTLVRNTLGDALNIQQALRCEDETLVELRRVAHDLLKAITIAAGRAP